MQIIFLNRYSIYSNLDSKKDLVFLEAPKNQTFGGDLPAPKYSRCKYYWTTVVSDIVQATYYRRKN